MTAQARLGIDIGGTFTDFALETIENGHTRHYFAKVLTTPQAPEMAVLEGVDRVLAQAGLRADQLVSVVHGTTLATNAVIERRGARIAFITTEGFRDTLEMGTESRYDHYDLNVDKPAPMVPRDLRFVVPERMSASGAVLKPLDESAVRALLPKLDEANVEAVAIGFLHSYANTAHEKRGGRNPARSAAAYSAFAVVRGCAGNSRVRAVCDRLRECVSFNRSSRAIWSDSKKRLRARA